MPYKILKSGPGYFVVDNKGMKLEKKPIPLKKAIKQRIAVYLSKKSKGENVKDFFA